MKQFKLLVSLMVLFFATNMFAQTWTAQTNPVSGVDVNSAWAVDTVTCWMCGASTSQTLGYVIRTTNAGTTWTNVTGDMPVSAAGLYSICGISATEAWAGVNDGSVYHTTNSGTHWTFVSMPSPVTAFVDVIHFYNQNTGFIIGDPATTTWCYYWTTNAGVNWTAAGPTFTGSEAGWNNSYFTSDTGHIWFGTNNTKIYHGGLRSTFTSAASTGLNSYGMAVPNNINGVAVMTSTTPAVLANNITTNGGTSWSAGYLPAGIQFGIKAVPGFPYVWTCGAGTTGGVILFSSNNGVNWTQQFTTTAAGYGMTFATVNRGWVGCSGGTIYRYTGILSEVNNNNTSVPVSYKLEQNFPNPFNPTTTINYSIPKTSFVTLKVYNVLGNEVMSVVNEQQTANNYTYTLDFSKLSSGAYYYTLRAGDYSATKKLMLVK